jgi:hypothetical protein
MASPYRVMVLGNSGQRIPLRYILLGWDFKIICRLIFFSIIFQSIGPIVIVYTRAEYFL